MAANVKRSAAAGLTLGAIGVVFGDIGTSPLYALQAVFGNYGLKLPVDALHVHGIISLIIWSVTLVVSVKYLSFVMRADNHGEGGIMALVTLLKHDRTPFKQRWLLILLGIVGIALFYGDSSITPAISVLSAVEGLQVVSPNLKLYVIPVTLTLLALLFWIQRYGTGIIGKIFGPIMLVWFIVIGGAGAANIWLHPSVLAALSPLAALRFVAAEPGVGLLSLGAVVLAITGAEALYADMGHFGRPAIRRGWFMLVFPALLLCYVGQGATLLAAPVQASTAATAGFGISPFMALFPAPLQFGVVVLATLATLIASQSVISGAFSLTRQAIQLDFLPRMIVRHTSNHESGQVYVPLVNFCLFAAVAMLIVLFGSSGRLAGVYGIAVSGTLAIDTILFLAVAREIQRRSRPKIVLLACLFLTVDICFVAANLPKVLHGGWLPIALAAAVFVVIDTWYRGQQIVSAERRAKEGPLQHFIDNVRVAKPPIARLPGCAVYIGHHRGLAPLALHAAVEKLHELHQRVVVVSVTITRDAHIPEHRRAAFNNLAYDDGISQLQLSYGYHDSPNVPRTLAGLRGINKELDFDPASASYFISLSRVVPSRRHNLASWRKSLYSLMARNALSTSDYYHLPVEQTVEVRSLIEL